MPRKPAGVGAVGSAKARFFHPSAPIREQWPNTHGTARLSGVRLTGKEPHDVNRREQLCYACEIPELPHRTFYIACSNFKVEESPTTPFPDELALSRNAPAGSTAEEQNRDRVLRTDAGNVARNINDTTEIEELRQQGITVDDDNDPAPENAVPQAAGQPDVGVWITPTICPRRADGCANNKGTRRNHSWLQVSQMDKLALFRMCFPEEWVIGSLIPATNRELGRMAPLTLSEFYVWLGCHFFMCCYEGVSDRRMWWSAKPVSIDRGAPFRLNEFMSSLRFKEVTAAMRYTNLDPPPFVDRFHDVREMIDAFNNHYAAQYIPSWLNCLDESMNSWMDKWAPGFMSVPRKPHPFGNEYHSIADGDDGKAIMWRIKLQEGKDRPKGADGKWAYPSEFEGTNAATGRKYTNTSTLMCEMTKPIHGTGKVVSMDSGFCVTVGILHLHDHGVYGQSLIKKRKYWPKFVPGDQIDRYFAGKELGTTKTLRQIIDGVQFNVHCTRDDRYVTKLMSSHGLLTEEDHTTYRQKSGGEWVTFKYSEPLSRHNKSKHWVDDVNNRRHDPIGLEDVWGTKWWPTRQFTFICSVAEANAVQSRARARKETPTPQLEFRRALALRMLRNRISHDGRIAGSPMTSRKRQRLSRGSPVVDHKLEVRPNYTGKWNTEKNTWNQISTQYAKTKCAGCKNLVRTYCRCNRQQSLCSQCFGVHMVTVNSTS